MKFLFNVTLQVSVEAENEEHGEEVMRRNPPVWEVSGAGYSPVLGKQHGGGLWPAGYRISRPEIMRVELRGEPVEDSCGKRRDETMKGG